jgi:hypothetical protein
MEPMSSSETSAETQLTTQRHIPEDDTLQCTYSFIFYGELKLIIFFSVVISCICARQRLGKNPLIVARQWLGRNVTAVTNVHTIEESLDTLFSMWPVSYQGK